MKIDVNPSVNDLSTNQSEILILQKLNLIDELKTAKKQLDSDHKQMLKQRGKAQTQHLKNMERMKAEINKRIEQLL